MLVYLPNSKSSKAYCVKPLASAEWTGSNTRRRESPSKPHCNNSHGQEWSWSYFSIYSGLFLHLDCPHGSSGQLFWSHVSSQPIKVICQVSQSLARVSTSQTRSILGQLHSSYSCFWRLRHSCFREIPGLWLGPFGYRVFYPMVYDSLYMACPIHLWLVIFIWRVLFYSWPSYQSWCLGGDMYWPECVGYGTTKIFTSYWPNGHQFYHNPHWSNCPKWWTWRIR